MASENGKVCRDGVVLVKGGPQSPLKQFDNYESPKQSPKSTKK